jgi:hypothetical protein
MGNVMRRKSTRIIGGALLIGLSAAGAVHAQTADADSGQSTVMPPSVASRLDTLEQTVRQQRELLERQGRQLDAQVLELETEQQMLAQQRRQTLDVQTLGVLRGGGEGDAAGSAAATTQASAAISPAPPPSDGQSTPVGEAPPAPEPAANLVAVLPDNSGVLTLPGHWSVEPALTYSQSSSDRLVFEGVEIVTGIQIGVIQANKAVRDSDIGSLTVRYGLTPRAEIQVYAPYVYRNDTITTLQQRDAQISSSTHLSDVGIGDVEVTGRYQLNNGGGGMPVFVANLRVKSDTGTNPYTVQRDKYGVATQLALGSGFWAFEPSVSILMVSDPVVMFANISWLRNIPENINQTIGGVLIGRVTPGDTGGGSLGFAFSINPQFSFSLGYRHSYLFGTTTELGGTNQRSTPLTVGSLLLGMSYRVSDTVSINPQFEFGVTADAPNVTLTLRMPLSF